MSKLLNNYNELKKKDASIIYLFRVGIFYNILNEDAKLLNQELGLKITNLSPEIIKCGFPINSLNKYIEKLNKKQLKYKIIDTAPKELNIDSYYKIINKIRKIDIDHINGVQALNILSELKKEVEN